MAVTGAGLSTEGDGAAAALDVTLGAPVAKAAPAATAARST
jgi:hypothetical protein